MSIESIRQALTSAFANIGMELTLRPSLKAEQTGEVEILDYIACITSDDCFGPITKDVVKPTAEGRHLINTRRRRSSQSYREKQPEEKSLLQPGRNQLLNSGGVMSYSTVVQLCRKRSHKIKMFF